MPPTVPRPLTRGNNEKVAGPATILYVVTDFLLKDSNIPTGALQPIHLRFYVSSNHSCAETWT